MRFEIAEDVAVVTPLETNLRSDLGCFFLPWLVTYREYAQFSIEVPHLLVLTGFKYVKESVLVPQGPHEKMGIHMVTAIITTSIIVIKKMTFIECLFLNCHTTGDRNVY